MQILPELKKLFVIPAIAVPVGRSFVSARCDARNPATRADVTGSLPGYVRDTSGGVLPNATLTVIADCHRL